MNNGRVHTSIVTDVWGVRLLWAQTECASRGTGEIMPNRVVHELAGVLAGAGGAWLSSKGARNADPFLEIVGGAIAGYAGGVVPDVIDPPDSPNHRGIAHGLAAAALVASVPWNECAQDWRDEAARHRALAADPMLAKERTWHELAAIFCGLLAGAHIGLPCAYGSHLALDGVTPRSLPVVGLDYRRLLKPAA